MVIKLICDEYDRKEMELIWLDKLRVGRVYYDDEKGLIICIPEPVIPHTLDFLKEVIENKYWMNLEDIENDDDERIFKFRCIKIPIEQ